MATKKDLVEAHSFSRRRLVTAFVSGAPGGREVEPARPGRTIVGGIALAILLVAGAAVAGVFKSRVEVDWDQPGIVQDKDTGDLFVVLPGPDDTGIAGDEPRVRGVVNVTSARLILGSETELQSVPHEEVADEPKGATIGIPGAPSAPATDSLIESGWTACTRTGDGIRVAVSNDDLVTPTPDTAYTVRSGKKFFLIAESEGQGDEARRAYAYPVPRGTSDQLLSALGGAVRSSAIEVPSAFIGLFPPGGALDETGLGLEGIGDPAPSGSGVPEDARIGDTFEQDGGVGIFTQDGPTVAISPFAEAVLDQARKRGFDSQERDVDDVDDLVLVEAPYEERSHWPSDAVETESDALDASCAVLDPRSDDEPVVTLATQPVGEADPAGVAAQGSDVYVDTGNGAVVISAGMDSTSGDTAVLLDDRGYSYELIGSAVSGLGYGDVSLPLVPQSWIGLFREGVGLSRDLALCPPDLDDKSDQCGA